MSFKPTKPTKANFTKPGYTAFDPPRVSKGEHNKRDKQIKRLLGGDHFYSDFENGVYKTSRTKGLLGRPKTVTQHVGYYTRTVKGKKQRVKKGRR